MKRILTILGLFLFGLTSQKATACSCVGESTVEGGYKSADVVATGEIINIETEWLPDSTKIKEMVELGFPADSLDKRLNGYYLKNVLVKVENVYKGNATTDTLTIYTGMGGGDCGFRFTEGQKYVIYGDTDSYFGDFFKDQEFPDGQNVYWTNICTRTQEHNRKEIKELEKLKNKNGR
jgi:hypothetical protein